MRILATLIFVSLATRSLACTCLPNPPVSESFANADSVFTGQVVASKPIGTELDLPKGIDPEVLKKMVEGTDVEIKNGKLMRYRRLVTFQVKEAFKGAGEGKVSVVTETHETACGIDFILGKAYLVYAKAGDTHLNTGLCTRTRKIGDGPTNAKSEKELKALRELRGSGPEPQ